jgi:hypothetical protein
MSDPHLPQNNDELTPVLHRALVEIGALIPTTPEAVELAETHVVLNSPPTEVSKAFERVLGLLNGTSKQPPFMRLDDCVAPLTEERLALAARKGRELDAETLAKIERDVAEATRDSNEI